MMIFITIGTQEPFDRLIKEMDSIAGSYPNIRFVAQTANTSYTVKNMETVNLLAPAQFDELFEEASLIVSHAGMGTIISALKKQKPILVFPRQVALKEHRNDHQMATARKMHELGYVHVAFDNEELKTKLANLISESTTNTIKPLHILGEHASDSLIQSLRTFIYS